MVGSSMKESRGTSGITVPGRGSARDMRALLDPAVDPHRRQSRCARLPTGIIAAVADASGRFPAQLVGDRTLALVGCGSESAFIAAELHLRPGSRANDHAASALLRHLPSDSAVGACASGAADHLSRLAGPLRIADKLDTVHGTTDVVMMSRTCNRGSGVSDGWTRRRARGHGNSPGIQRPAHGRGGWNW
jgi:hypothetical protein